MGRIMANNISKYLKLIILLPFLFSILVVTYVWIISSQSHSCDMYVEMIDSEELGDQLIDWVNTTLPIGERLSVPSEHLKYSSWPGNVRFEGDYDLGFLPQWGIGMSVDLYLDKKNQVSAVYIGRSGRAGLVILTNGSFDNFKDRRLIIKSNGKVGVYCTN